MGRINFIISTWNIWSGLGFLGLIFFHLSEGNKGLSIFCALVSLLFFSVGMATIYKYFIAKDGVPQ